MKDLFKKVFASNKNNGEFIHLGAFKNLLKALSENDLQVTIVKIETGDVANTLTITKSDGTKETVTIKTA